MTARSTPTPCGHHARKRCRIRDIKPAAVDDGRHEESAIPLCAVIDPRLAPRSIGLVSRTNATNTPQAITEATQ